MAGASSTPPSEARNRSQNPWWADAVIYQVYPRFFADAHGNGMGDMVGVTARMPYLQRLRVDALWLSPTFVSPQTDVGYGVADYRDADPLFGTLAEADALIDGAHEAGLRIVVDLVRRFRPLPHVVAHRSGGVDAGQWDSRTGRWLGLSCRPFPGRRKFQRFGGRESRSPSSSLPQARPDLRQ